MTWLSRSSSQDLLVTCALGKTSKDMSIPHNMSIKYPSFVNPVAGSDGEADDDDEEKNETQDGSQEAVLRDYRYNLQVTLMASQRALKASLFFQWSIFYRWEPPDR